MSDKEILKLYYGWKPELLKAITAYVHKFHIPWPLYGPRDEKTIWHCVETGKSLDELPKTDSFKKKYLDEIKHHIY